MSEYEMMELIAIYQSTAVTEIMAYFTVLSAYCIVAFVVGPNLSRSQVNMITGLFLVMTLFLIWGMASHLMVAREVLAEVASMPDNKLGTVFVPFLKPHQVAIPLLLIGVLSGLKFMWDIRHPKTN